VQNAKPKLVSLFNSTTNPSVKLVEKKPDGRWVGKITVKINGGETDVEAWLAANKLTYD
jgi:hypothetical protein